MSHLLLVFMACSLLRRLRRRKEALGAIVRRRGLVPERSECPRPREQKGSSPKTRHIHEGFGAVFVRRKGLEPSRPCGHRHLKPARLPIPPPSRGPKSSSSSRGSLVTLRDPAVQEVTNATVRVACHDGMNSHVVATRHQMRIPPLLSSRSRPIRGASVWAVIQIDDFGELPLRPSVRREPNPLLGSEAELRSRYPMLAHLVLKVAEQHPSLPN